MKKKRSGQKPQKLLVVCGPTATGKSALAVELARKFDGEVISADSRQVYRGLNIGTGKITRREMRGVRHHLLDVADPKAGDSSKRRRFAVDDYKKLAQAAIAEIASRGRLPILCGGTGFYIQAVVDDIVLPDVPPDPKLRARLEKIATAKLFAMLKKLDPQRAKTIDRQNPRRLIRAIEIAQALGTSSTVFSPATVFTPATPFDPSIVKEKFDQRYDLLFIGLDLPADQLRRKIRGRLLARLQQGMIAEARGLHSGRSKTQSKTQSKSGKSKSAGLSWRRMNELGLEYRYLALFLQKKPPCRTRAQLVEKLSTEIWRYARRQRTWFRRDKRIIWFTPGKKQKAVIISRVKKWLK